jgi:hypothetical protein
MFFLSNLRRNIAMTIKYRQSNVDAEANGQFVKARFHQPVTRSWNGRNLRIPAEGWSRRR